VSITNYSVVRLGGITEVTVTSDLSGTIYYHWYRYGNYLGMSTAATWSFYLTEGEQARVECIDTNDADFDAVAGAPTDYPPTRTIWWTASTDSDVDKYRVEQNKAAAGWETIGTIYHEQTRWEYELETEALDDLTSYQFRVVPVDQAGNDGTALTLAAEKIVRRPDSPDFTISFDEGTTKVTFSAAA